MLLALPHRLGVLALRHAGLGRREFAGAAGRVEAAAQRFDDGRAQRLPVALGAGVQQRDAARQVVEHEQRFGRDVGGLRQPVALGAIRRQALEEAHDVVAGRSHETAVERNAVDLRLEQRRALESAAHHRLPLGRVRGSALRFTVDREPVRVKLDGYGIA